MFSKSVEESLKRHIILKPKNKYIALIRRIGGHRYPLLYDNHHFMPNTNHLSLSNGFRLAACPWVRISFLKTARDCGKRGQRKKNFGLSRILWSWVKENWMPTNFYDSFTNCPIACNDLANWRGRNWFSCVTYFSNGSRVQKWPKRLLSSSVSYIYIYSGQHQWLWGTQEIPQSRTRRDTSIPWLLTCVRRGSGNRAINLYSSVQPLFRSNLKLPFEMRRVVVKPETTIMASVQTCLS